MLILAGYKYGASFSKTEGVKMSYENENDTLVAEPEVDESVDVDMTDENADTPTLELDE